MQKYLLFLKLRTALLVGALPDSSKGELARVFQNNKYFCFILKINYIV